MTSENSQSFVEKNFQNRTEILVYILLSVSVLAVFAKTLFFQYVWDDPVLLEGMARLLQNKQLSRVWTEPLWAAIDLPQASYYRPMHMLTYLLDIWAGRDPFFSHALHGVIHLLNALLVYFVLKHISKKTWVAGFAAAFWALHPLTAESVGWITLKTALISHLTLLLSFVFIFRFQQIGKFSFVWLSALCSFWGMTTKEITLVHAVFPLMYVWISSEYNARKFMKICLPTCIFTGLFLLLFWNANRHQPAIEAVQPLNFRPSVFLAVGIDVLRRLFLPFHLMADYPLNEYSWIPSNMFTEGIATGVLLSLLLGSYFLTRKKSPLALILVMVFAPVLPAAIYVYQVGSVADRYLYTSLFGISFLMASISWPAKRWLVLSLLSILGVLSFLTFQQLDIWRDDFSLAQDMVNKNPASRFGHMNLGNEFARRGDYAAAKSHYMAVQKLDPRDGIVKIHLAQVEASMNHGDEASKWLMQAEYLKSQSPLNRSYYETCVKIFTQFKNETRAKVCLEELTALDPQGFMTLLLQGIFSLQNGDIAGAKSFLEKAEATRSHNVELWMAWVQWARQARNADVGIHYLTKLCALNPDPIKQNDLALFWMLKGDKQKAKETLIAALKVFPDHPLLLHNYRLLFPG